MRNLNRTPYADSITGRRTYTGARDYACLVTRTVYKEADDEVFEPIIDMEPILPPDSVKRQLALLIAGHNEELVIEQTLRSAIAAGMNPADIYVVDDNSGDTTKQIAISVLGKENVLRVRRSGKGLALTKGARKFKLTKRYEWIHIADADGGFATDYFNIFRARLDPKFAAATGYVRSLPGSTIGQYRVFEYTIGMEIHRRFQAMTHTVAVIPGPTSCFRADVFEQVNFANKSLTEDFDVTVQIHRGKLGNIQFIPEAVAYTQDPRTLGDFKNQITRWNRGVMQGIQRHRIGLRPSRLDAYLSFQIMQNFLLLFNYAVILPYLAYVKQTPEVLAVAFLMDVLILFAIALAVAIRSGRGDILAAFPQLYVYRWVTLYVFTKAFVDVLILGKFRVTEGVWGTAGRRFKNPVSV